MKETSVGSRSARGPENVTGVGDATKRTTRPLIPAPRVLVEGHGVLVLRDQLSIYAGPEAAESLMFLQERLWRGARIRALPATHHETTIHLGIDSSLRPEEYRLRVRDRGIRVAGGDAAGIQYGVGTLLQLMPNTVWQAASVDQQELRVPFVEIIDRPAYEWRGLMLDVARHFQPVHEIRRLIDLLAMHRFNRLHLHLSDDQGWRIEILKYPRLTTVGSWRRSSQVGADDATAPEDGRPHGGYYTQREMRELVAYASARGITIVPEIDLPGHSQAAIAAYPELGIPRHDHRALEVGTRWGTSIYPLNAESSTIDFYRDVLDEVFALFPSELIGLGGDECPSEAWESDERSLELVQERELDGPDQLPAWILSELRSHLVRNNRRMLAWDEILEHGEIDGDTVVVLGWRGDVGLRACLARGISVVACPDDSLYFDYRQSADPDEPIPVGVVVDLEAVYGFSPTPLDVEEDARGLVVGAQANLWTEHLDSSRSVDYMLWPRACALAEVLWTGPGGSFDSFERRLSLHLERLTVLGVEYRRPEGPEPWRARPGVGTRVSTPDERAAEVASLTSTIAAAY